MAHHRERPEAQFHLSQSCLQKHEQGRESTSRSARRQRYEESKGSFGENGQELERQSASNPRHGKQPVALDGPFFSFGPGKLSLADSSILQPNQRCLCLGYGHRTQSRLLVLACRQREMGRAGFVEQNSRGCSRFEYSGPGPFGRIQKRLGRSLRKGFGPDGQSFASPG